VAAHVAEVDPAAADQRVLIEHSEGLLLFDTGQDRASVTDDSYFPGGFTGYLYDCLTRFHIGEEDTFTAQLATIGYSPSDVDTADPVSPARGSHRWPVRAARRRPAGVHLRWQELTKAAPEPRGFLRKHIQIPGLKWHQISFEPVDDPALAPFTESLDVMGDGSLVLLPLSVTRPARCPYSSGEERGRPCC
jgi:N-acyl homoserine lactone hydrolase